MSEKNRKSYQKRLDKYLPNEGMLKRRMKRGSENITVYGWKSNPVELWVWDIGPGGPSKIELHKLEEYPTLENIGQALALYTNWREEHKRRKGAIAGPGLGKDAVLRECYSIWQESGYAESVLKELEPKYVNSRPDHQYDNASESYYRQMRRLKAKDTKNQKP